MMKAREITTLYQVGMIQYPTLEAAKKGQLETLLADIIDESANKPLKHFFNELKEHPELRNFLLEELRRIKPMTFVSNEARRLLEISLIIKKVDGDASLSGRSRIDEITAGDLDKIYQLSIDSSSLGG